MNNPVTIRASAIGGSYNDYINSIIETDDGGYISGGYFHSRSITIGDYTLINNGNYNMSDGMVIKCDANNNIEWARSIGGEDSDVIDSVIETKDGGYIVGGYFESDSITIGNYTLTNTGGSDRMLIKYNNNGEVEWAISIGGMSNDYVNSISVTNDGGFAVGGYFSGTVTIGGYELTSNGNSDGLIIKYDANGNVIWVNTFGGQGEDRINAVSSTINNNIIVVGDFKSDKINVGNYELTKISNASYHQDSIIIKYDANGNVTYATSLGDVNYENSLETIVATNDGGFVTGGYYF